MRASNSGRIRRLVVGATCAAAAAAGAAACDPEAGGGLSRAAVALATDQAGTEALERAGLKVQWMSCTAEVGSRPGTGTASRTPQGGNSAKVECEGETTGRTKLALKGRVTEERDGRCVRGDLVAKAGGRTVFRADVLGNCDAEPSRSTPTRPTPTRPTGEPPDRPTVTETVHPTPSRPDEPDDPGDPGEPSEKPPVTVTVTGTPTPSPSCDCEEDEGKDGGKDGDGGKGGGGGEHPPEHEPVDADR